jgi:hypothetical protein
MVALLAACSPQGAAVASAVILAGTASAVSRATGGCYADCVHGTACNEATGLCEVLPCRGLCDETQECDETGAVPKCVKKKADITITTEKEDTTPPQSQPPE